MRWGRKRPGIQLYNPLAGRKLRHLFRRGGLRFIGNQSGHDMTTNQFMFAAFAGALAGLLHVFSGPDHLAAVAPLSLEHGPRSWRIGLGWGVGHSAGVIVLGLVLLLLKEFLPLEGISSWAERLVGVVLIGIGIWGLRKAFANKVHLHAHQHGGEQHAHFHVHGTKTAHSPARSSAHQHSHAVMGVGMLHGLAGGSHLMNMVVALAFPTRVQTLTYIGTYVLGTVTAMSFFSLLVGWIAARWAVGSQMAYRNLMVACSVVALLLGGYWLLAPVGP